MGQYKKLWFTLIGVLIVTFSLLGYYGAEVYRQAPPIPAQVSAPGGKLLFDREGILDGQTAWQSVGGMQLGSIWGHGAYQAPDWTADWLHRELMAWLELAAQDQHGKAYAALDGPALAMWAVTPIHSFRKAMTTRPRPHAVSARWRRPFVVVLLKQEARHG